MTWYIYSRRGINTLFVKDTFLFYLHWPLMTLDVTEDVPLR